MSCNYVKQSKSTPGFRVSKSVGMGLHGNPKQTGIYYAGNSTTIMQAAVSWLRLST